jgi:hypothetical protein
MAATTEQRNQTAITRSKIVARSCGLIETSFGHEPTAQLFAGEDP